MSQKTRQELVLVMHIATDAASFDGAGTKMYDNSCVSTEKKVKQCLKMYDNSYLTTGKNENNVSFLDVFHVFFPPRLSLIKQLELCTSPSFFFIFP